jgi:PTH1 family peptidyl-tRNA hydrolase
MPSFTLTSWILLHHLKKPNVEKVSVMCQVTLLKPKLFMNESGRAVAAGARLYGLHAQDIMVVHDDLDRELGKVGSKNSGSTHGHNGLRSVADCLRSDAFCRLRVGIGRPPGTSSKDPDTVSDWVLGKFSEQERRKLEKTSTPAAVDMVKQWLQERTLAAIH